MCNITRIVPDIRPFSISGIQPDIRFHLPVNRISDKSVEQMKRQEMLVGFVETKIFFILFKENKFFIYYLGGYPVSDKYPVQFSKTSVFIYEIFM